MAYWWLFVLPTTSVCSKCVFNTPAEEKLVWWAKKGPLCPYWELLQSATHIYTQPVKKKTLRQPLWIETEYEWMTSGPFNYTVECDRVLRFPAGHWNWIRAQDNSTARSASMAKRRTAEKWIWWGNIFPFHFSTIWLKFVCIWPYTRDEKTDLIFLPNGTVIWSRLMRRCLSSHHSQLWGNDSLSFIAVEKWSLGQLHVMLQ